MPFDGVDYGNRVLSLAGDGCDLALAAVALQRVPEAHAEYDLRPEPDPGPAPGMR